MDKGFKVFTGHESWQLLKLKGKYKDSIPVLKSVQGSRVIKAGPILVMETVKG